MVITTYPTFGYTQISLPDKLGYKPETSIVYVALPDELAELPELTNFAKVSRRQDWTRPLGPVKFDAIHAFTDSRAELAAGLPKLRKALEPDGAIWISWPKRRPKHDTDLSEDVVRAEAMKLDLVDVKLAAIDHVWSSLKFVLRPSRR